VSRLLIYMDSFIAKAGTLISVLDRLHSSWFSCCGGRERRWFPDEGFREKGLLIVFMCCLLCYRVFFLLCFEISVLDSSCGLVSDKVSRI
jgi:hypothetical protein